MIKVAELTIQTYPAKRVGEQNSKEKYVIKYDSDDIDFVRLRFLDFINWYFDMERKEMEPRMKEEI